MEWRPGARDTWRSPVTSRVKSATVASAECVRMRGLDRDPTSRSRVAGQPRPGGQKCRTAVFFEFERRFFSISFSISSGWMTGLRSPDRGQLPWVDAERPRRATGVAPPHPTATPEGPVRGRGLPDQHYTLHSSGFRQHKSNGRVTQSNGPITRPHGHAPSRPKSLARPRWRAQTGAAARSTPPSPRGCLRQRVPAHPCGPKGAKGS